MISKPELIKQVVASYTYPDHPMVCDVVGYYESWKKLYMDEASHYQVYDENGENLDYNDTVWTSVPSREDVRDRYVEVTFS